MTALVKPSNIMAYHNIQEAGIEKQQPEFGRIIDALRESVAFTMEMAKSTAIQCNSLKPMLSNKQQDPECKQESFGVVGYLWEQINLLQKANSIALENLTHLKEVVGT